MGPWKWVGGGHVSVSRRQIQLLNRTPRGMGHCSRNLFATPGGLSPRYLLPGCLTEGFSLDDRQPWLRSGKTGIRHANVCRATHRKRPVGFRSSKDGQTWVGPLVVDGRTCTVSVPTDDICNVDYTRSRRTRRCLFCHDGMSIALRTAVGVAAGTVRTRDWGTSSTAVNRFTRHKALVRVGST